MFVFVFVCAYVTCVYASCYYLFIPMLMYQMNNTCMYECTCVYVYICVCTGKRINLQVPFMLQGAIDTATSAVTSGTINAADGLVVKKVSSLFLLYCVVSLYCIALYFVLFHLLDVICHLCFLAIPSIIQNQ